MPKTIKTKQGDVFAIQLDADLYAYGQIVAKGKTSDCIVAFDYFTQTIEHNPREIVHCPIVFLYHTIDLELVNGRWRIIGNVPLSFDIVLPEYKTETPTGFKVLSARGEVLRDAIHDEIKQLGYLKSYAPRMLEKALKAKYGLIPWKDWMNEIVYSQ